MGETTVVKTGEEAAGDVVAPIVDVAKDVGAIGNETVHHAETLSAHALQLAEHEARWKTIQDQMNQLSETVARTPEEMTNLVTSMLDRTRSEILEQVKSLASEAKSFSDGSGEKSTPPREVEPKKEHKRNGILAALHRLA